MEVCLCHSNEKDIIVWGALGLFFPLIQRQDTPNNTDNLYIDHPALSQIPVLSALGCSAIHEKILSDTHAQGCATRKSKFDIIELQIDIT